MNTDRVNIGTWAVRQMVKHSAMNPCPTPPVCEFGKYGCEADFWWRVGSNPTGHGGVFGMCGHRPLTRLELRQLFTRGDRMGQRPEVDSVNVMACDGVGQVCTNVDRILIQCLVCKTEYDISMWHMWTPFKGCVCRKCKGTKMEYVLSGDSKPLCDGV